VVKLAIKKYCEGGEAKNELEAIDLFWEKNLNPILENCEKKNGYLYN